MSKNITPEYTRKAIKNYQSKFDRVNINLDAGTAERIRATGESVNGFIRRLVYAELEKIEKREAAPGE